MKFVSRKPYLIAAALLATSVADAALIDFTDRSIWGTGGSGSVTKSYVDLQVTVQAFNAVGSTSFTNLGFDGGDSAICGSLVCQSDGIGIGGDELRFGKGPLTSLERLTVSFDRAVNVETIWVLDLFAAVRGDSAGAEVFHVAANGLDGQWASWTGTDTTTHGFFTATSDNATALSSSAVFMNVWSLDFFASDLGVLSSPENSDFAVAGLEVSTVSVPEPGTLGLLGFGLLGIFGATRRRAVSP